MGTVYARVPSGSLVLLKRGADVFIAWEAAAVMRASACCTAAGSSTCQASSMEPGSAGAATDEAVTFPPAPLAILARAACATAGLVPSLASMANAAVIQPRLSRGGAIAV